MLVLVKVYDRIHGLEAARAGQALRHAREIIATERVLHLDVELSWTRWLATHPTLSLVASWWYQLAHLTVTLSVLVWCYLLRPDAYRRARWALVLTNAAGLAVFLVYAVAPPRLLPASGYADVVAAAGFG